MKNKLLFGFLLILSFSIYPNEDVYLAQIGNELSYYEAMATGQGKKSPYAAERRHSAYLKARTKALRQCANFIGSLITADNYKLNELASSDSTLLVLLEETLLQARVIERSWDEKDEATVILRVDLEEFKIKLKRIGVE